MSRFKSLQTEVIRVVTDIINYNPIVLKRPVPHSPMYPTESAIITIYLNAFSPEERQGHSCNACKSFLDNYGTIVFVSPAGVQSIWGMLNLSKVDPIYHASIVALNKYVNSLGGFQIVGRSPNKDFYVGMEIFGKDQNFSEKHARNFNHFYMPNFHGMFISEKLNDAKNDISQAVEAFYNKLCSYDIKKLEKVSEILTDKKVNRASNYYDQIDFIIDMKKRLSGMMNSKEAYLTMWMETLRDIAPETRDKDTIKTTINRGIHFFSGNVLYTLIDDLHSGLTETASIAKFNSLTSAANFNRTTTEASPMAIRKAKETLVQEGFMDSLNRRLATIEDIPLEEMIFSKTRDIVHNSAIEALLDNVDGQKPVDVKKLKNVQPLTLNELKEMLKNGEVSKLEVLVDNSVTENLVSIVTENIPNSRQLFAWNSPVSWSYVGGYTDRVQQKVKEAGGTVEGKFRASLSWNNTDDLDLYMTVVLPGRGQFSSPERGLIYYGSKRSHLVPGAALDVDMNISGESTDPVENIIFTQGFPEGTYTIGVKNHKQRNGGAGGFDLQVKVFDEILNFSYPNNKLPDHPHDMVRVTVDKKGKYTITPLNGQLSSTGSSLAGREFWGLKTLTWSPITSIFKSPNKWGDGVKKSQEHTFFIIDKCLAPLDETILPFYNEFLHKDLVPHRRSLELFSSKVGVFRPENQDSIHGIGISESFQQELHIRINSGRVFKLTVNK